MLLCQQSHDNSRENEGQAFLLSQLQDFITIKGTTTTTGNNNWHYNLCPHARSARFTWHVGKCWPLARLPVLSLVMLQSSSLSPCVLALASHRGITSRGYVETRRQSKQSIGLQNQWLSSWSWALAQLGVAGLASLNTGCFWAGSDCYWLLPAYLRKKCYHSCNLVQESKRF